MGVLGLLAETIFPGRAPRAVAGRLREFPAAGPPVVCVHTARPFALVGPLTGLRETLTA